jgi:hypothetical protein
MRTILAAVFACVLAAPLSAQTDVRIGGSLFVQTTEPSAALVQQGTFWFDTSAGSLKVSIGPSTWTTIGGSSEAVPTGAILAIVSGTCPAGYAEVSALNGRTLVGTLAANGNVGTTGGADNITPAGTNSAPTFTGSALGNHLHAFGTIAVAAHTVVATKQGAAAGNVVTTATHTVSGSTANASAGTPAGTVTAPTFTGTSFDNRSSFTFVIFCSKT